MGHGICTLQMKELLNFEHFVQSFLAARVDGATSCVPTCDVAPVGQRGDQARHLLVGVQEDHQQGCCVRVPGAGAVKRGAS